MIIAIVVAILISAVLFKTGFWKKVKNNSGNQSDKLGVPISWIIMATTVIIVANVAIWKTIPWLWIIIFHDDWWCLIITNVSILLILYLGVLKVDVNGKDNNPIAMKLKTAITWIVILAIGTSAVELSEPMLKKYQEERVAKKQATLRKPTLLVPDDFVFEGLPMKDALQEIAKCESGGNQFETDGVTPLKNREGSSAIGKYQIMASLHRERAWGMGFDINTLEGNEGYARVLFSESGTQHWEADPKSKACWAPKLVALGYDNPRWDIDVQPQLASAEKSGPFERMESAFLVKPVKNEIIMKEQIIMVSDRWSKGFDNNRDKKPPQFSSPGNRFFVRFNAVRTVEFDGEGRVVSGGVPEKVRFFEIKSGEPEQIPVNIKFM